MAKNKNKIVRLNLEVHLMAKRKAPPKTIQKYIEDLIIKDNK